LQQQIEAMQRQMAATAAPAATPAPAETPLYSAEEQTALDAYHTEWKDVAVGEALVRRAEYKQLVGYIFGQIAPHLDALRTSTETTSARTRYTVLRERVADYDQVRDATLAWVATQPPYLRAAYESVTNNGTPEDVVDLIGRFKKETGYVSKTAAPVASAPAAAPVSSAPAPLSAEVAAAVASLRPVTSGRTEPAQASDPNDFDAAFAEFARASTK